MDLDGDRVGALEQRVRRVEQRIELLEAARTRVGTAPEAVAETHTQVESHPLPPPAPTPGAVRLRFDGPPTQSARALAPGAPPARSPAPATVLWRPESPGPAPIPRKPVSLKDLEERFAGRALAWAGGIALIAAALFFLSLAFSRGWITEPMRVVVGLAAGVAGFSAGAFLLAKGNALVGNVLTGVGLGIVSISFFAATRLYGLVPPEVGLLGALLAAVAAAVVAVRYDAQSVAAYGLVAALAAPPLVGASPTLLTLLFVAVTLVGTTAVSLFRSWRWLPGIAFLLAAPQLASWVAGDPGTSQALVALAGFWAVNIVAAAGEEVRVRRDDLRPSSSILVLANAAFLLWGLTMTLSGDLEPWLGAAIAIAAVAHLLVGAWFLRRQGLEHLFGNLVAGTGVALVTIAAFVQLGAALVPVAWAAEAVALAWLAVRRLHRWSALGAVVLGGLAMVHLLILEYPVAEAGIPPTLIFSPPLLHPEAATLGAILLALAVTVAIVQVCWIRSVLAGIGILLVAWALPFEVAGATLIALLAVLLPVGVLLDRALVRLPDDERLVAVTRVRPVSLFASAAGSIAWVAASVIALGRFLGQADWGLTTPPAIPFSDEIALIGLLLTGTALAAGVWLAPLVLRRVAVLAAIATAAWIVPFEVHADLVVVAWVVLAAAAVLVTRWDPRGAIEYAAIASVLWVLGAGVAFGIVAQPDRLWVVDTSMVARGPMSPPWWLAFAALALSAGLAPRYPVFAEWRTALELTAGGVALYAVSVGVVAFFQVQAGGPVAVEELAKQAQVALSVCWTAIGAALLLAGLSRHRPMLRHAGFALLALATAKVFVIDLASMDVAYRAVVFAGLGLLLLASAYLVTRFRGPRGGPTDVAGGPHPAG